MPIFRNSYSSSGVTYNISIVNATTTTTNDSIKITGADSALSSTNVGYVYLNSTATAGRKAVFAVTADVTIKLTGAHWGVGTTGDLSNGMLNVYAINDSGTLRWGVAWLSNLEYTNSTLASATATNIDLPEEMLVTATVGAGTLPVAQIGWFRATFDDTGGAAEDLWAVSTNTYDLVVGKSNDGLWRQWNPTYGGGFSANPTALTTQWTMNGNVGTVVLVKNANGTSNGVNFTVLAPFKANGVYNFQVNNFVNNGTASGLVTLGQTTSTSTTLNLYTSGALAGWIGANGKSASFIAIYDVYHG